MTSTILMLAALGSAGASGELGQAQSLEFSAPLAGAAWCWGRKATFAVDVTNVSGGAVRVRVDPIGPGRRAPAGWKYSYESETESSYSVSGFCWRCDERERQLAKNVEHLRLETIAPGAKVRWFFPIFVSFHQGPVTLTIEFDLTGADGSLLQRTTLTSRLQRHPPAARGKCGRLEPG